MILYVFAQTLHHNQDATQSQFLNGEKQVSIQSFSSRFVASLLYTYS